MASVSRLIGEYKAIISVSAPGRVTVYWERASKKLKTVPSAVRADHATEYAELKELKKSIEASIKAQKSRIEKFFIEERLMSFSHWQKYFSNHALLGAICVNLVWVFSTKSEQFTAIYVGGYFMDKDGLEINVADSDVETVQLWHPLMADLTHLKSWQRYALEKKLDQPFKQIFRAHFREFPSSLDSLFRGIWVRQHQFRKLMIDNLSLIHI